MKRTLPLLLILAVIWGCFLAVKSAAARDTTVYSVLFYSPTCSHCAKLDREEIPVIQKKYGSKLVIVRINVVSAAGSKLYEETLSRFNVPENRIGVPTVIIGDSLLVGTVEIPEKFPGLVDAAISKGGLALPGLPGLYDLFVAQISTHPESLSKWQLMVYKFKQDTIANSIAVIVLVFMVVSLIAAIVITLSSLKIPKVLTIFPDWIIPLLAMIGLAVAFYLSYVEVSETRAVCGPVGNCNAVQNSPYAKLFGILPTAVVGMAGYIAILAVWFLQKFGRASVKRTAWLVLWGLGIFSVLFSSYLTFLEPFIIGATCTFCLTSAIVVTIILWISTPPARNALRNSSENN